jgi:hypothetical protein
MIFTKEELKNHCLEVGFGNTMSVIKELWEDHSGKTDIGRGGVFEIGPCIATTVKCGCKYPPECDWCCGSGWLTRKVAGIKRVYEGSRVAG